MLEVKGFTKKYGKLTAMHDVSFKLHPGKLTTLLGPNGAGKSTLIKSLVGFEEPTAGRIYYNNQPWTKKERVRAIGWAPQDDSFYLNLTVYENLMFFAALFEISAKEAKERADEVLNMLELSFKKNTLAKNLSGGMKRRFNMAIALMHSPKVLILDEPEAGVDPLARMSLWNIIKKIKEENTEILLCTHNLVETEDISDIILIMNNGRIVFEGTPHELKKHGKNIEDAFKKIIKERK